MCLLCVFSNSIQRRREKIQLFQIERMDILLLIIIYGLIQVYIHIYIYYTHTHSRIYLCFDDSVCVKYEGSFCARAQSKIYSRRRGAK